MGLEHYWIDHAMIALEHLLLLETRAEERAILFASPLDEKKRELPLP